VTRLATIDLGSNTVRLLVVETHGAGRWRTLDHAQTVTRLGERLAAAGGLAEAAMKRTADAVATFCARAESLGAEEVLIVATSAVREAANRNVLLDLVRRVTGREIRVVSGEDEARLTLLGVLHGLGVPSGSSLLVDIGGGSTEFVLSRGGAVVTAVSLPLGVVPLSERYMTADPVDWTRYAEMARAVRDQLVREALPSFSGPRPDRMLGTAGTVTTLAALDQGLPAYDSGKVHGYVITRDRIERLLATLGAMPVAARASLPCLEPGRADLILAGVSICLAAMAAFWFRSMTVSDFGLREGILIERLAALTP
jgi:exopolyphosphatase/guanosine-5'-triphosphate,3'-diphosphate pyrophosphatase